MLIENLFDSDLHKLEKLGTWLYSGVPVVLQLIWSTCFHQATHYWREIKLSSGLRSACSFPSCSATNLILTFYSAWVDVLGFTFAILPTKCTPITICHHLNFATAANRTPHWRKQEEDWNATIFFVINVTSVRAAPISSWRDNFSVSSPAQHILEYRFLRVHRPRFKTGEHRAFDRSMRILKLFKMAVKIWSAIETFLLCNFASV